MAGSGYAAGVAELQVDHPGCPLFVREGLQVGFDIGLEIHDEGLGYSEGMLEREKAAAGF